MMEVVITLAIIAAFAAILTPILSNYVDQSRMTKAQADVKAIGEAISRFQGDVGVYPMFTTGTGLLQESSANVVTLRSPGNLPTEDSTTAWTSGSPTDSNCTSGCVYDDLQDQLLTNVALYTTSGNLAKPFKWKGPYIDSSTDPWGNMYLVNIINCKSGSTDACFVLSAGPNGKVETPFNNPEASTLTPTNDDIIYRIK